MIKAISLFLAIVAFAAYINANPTQCYECNILSGSTCTEPKIENLDIQSCDDINQANNSTADTVCFTVSTKWFGQLVTERGCYYQEIGGEDVCSYFYRTEVNNVPLTDGYTCDLCYEDLCNTEEGVVSAAKN
ncbi:uncharacterized protein LOC130898485 [Diorhabda carinulata]|uniref:uncharacterized protein LOC130442927 n=1 Tax=Diorhabda sublineata TaxID=1163346 RepID=UPI0024E0D75D|nr:uncharacterized protein LOC130442927 [Diorhabda sublineata]XP_057663809.1 uncharacterized protein LOC130898485 [Diorhabda carinulata]